MTYSATKITAMLPGLSQQELKLVRAAVDHLLEKNDQNLVYDAVCTVAGSKMPFTKFLGTKAGRAWQLGETSLLRFIDDTWGLTGRVGSNALMVYVLGLLADDLKNRKVPVSVSSLVLNMGSVPQVFDNAFPGYREDDLAKLVLDTMMKR